MILPLQSVTHRLFQRDPERALLSFFDDVLDRLGDETRLTRVDAQGAGASGDAAGAARRLGHLIGELGAMMCRISLTDDSLATPRLMTQDTSGQRSMIDTPELEHDAAIESFRERMATPDEGVELAALGYGAKVHLPRFRTDGLILEGSAQSPRIGCTLVLPYRPADDPAGFALHAPRLIGDGIDEALVPQLAAGFFDGFDSIQPTGLWAGAFVDEDDASELEARDLHPLTGRWGAEPDPFREINAEGLAARVQGLSEQEQACLTIERAAWMGSHPLNEVVDDAKRMLAHGQVVWASLVQANNLLFKAGPDGHPGVVVYDPQGLTGLSCLQDVAKSLFASRGQLDTLREQEPAGSAWLAIAEWLEDELTPTSGLPLPDTDAYSGLLVSMTFFGRRQLPAGYLQDRLIPCMLCADRPDRILPLPWPLWPTQHLRIWRAVDADVKTQDWQAARDANGHADSSDDEQADEACVQALERYAQSGLTRDEMAAALQWSGTGLRIEMRPAPREWECGLAYQLASLAEHRLAAVERAWVDRHDLSAEQAREVFATRYVSQLIELQRLMLNDSRGVSDNAFKLQGEEFLYAALGFICACDEAAAQAARMLLAAWRRDTWFEPKVSPAARACACLFASHLDLPPPVFDHDTRTQALRAASAERGWLDPRADEFVRQLRAACEEYVVTAPQGPFRFLPVPLLLMLKLRSLRGLPSPAANAISHPLLTHLPQSWPDPVSLHQATPPLVRDVLRRMSSQGFSAAMIEAALCSPDQARSAAPGEAITRPPPHRDPDALLAAERLRPKPDTGATQGLIACAMLTLLVATVLIADGAETPATTMAMLVLLAALAGAAAHFARRWRRSRQNTDDSSGW